MRQTIELVFVVQLAVPLPKRRSSLPRPLKMAICPRRGQGARLLKESEHSGLIGRTDGSEPCRSARRDPERTQAARAADHNKPQIFLRLSIVCYTRLVATRSIA
jgi:hypothetical protein